MSIDELAEESGALDKYHAAKPDSETYEPAPSLPCFEAWLDKTNVKPWEAENVF